LSWALLSQVDLYASLAHLVGQKINPDDAPARESSLNSWMEKMNEGKAILFKQAYAYGIRMGN
jgi:hypothetical protein